MNTVEIALTAVDNKSCVLIRTSSMKSSSPPDCDRRMVIKISCAMENTGGTGQTLEVSFFSKVFTDIDEGSDAQEYLDSARQRP